MPELTAPRETALRRIGHKGADALVAGNTIESFRAAAEIGVDMIELDVLWTRDGRPQQPAAERSPLVVAHDWGDAAGRDPLTLAEALDAFLEPPLDRVEVDCDLKLPGREEELAAALRERDLLPRAMVSTMEIPSIERLRGIEPALRLGWTYPKTTRDWTSRRWAIPGVFAALAAMRRTFPRLLERRAPQLGVTAVWAYHALATPRLVRAARRAGVELIAWTVDDPVRIEALRELGVDGICSNDPRLLDGGNAAR